MRRPVDDVNRSLPVAPPWHRYALVVAVGVVVLFTSVVDPSTAGPPRTLLGVDLAVFLHLVAYGGLAAAVGYALRSADRRALAVAVVVSALYGAGVELVQGTLSYRTMSAFDAVVNAGGAALGAGLWRLAAPWFGTER